MAGVHPKVVATTVTAAVAVIVAAITQGITDPATLVVAILTVVQFIAGYIVPGKVPPVPLISDAVELSDVPPATP